MPQETIDNYWLLYHADVQQLSHHEIRAMYNLTADQLKGRLYRLRGAIADSRKPSMQEYFASNGLPQAAVKADELDALMELAATAQEIQARYDPEITHHTIEIATKKPLAILLAGCSHLGSRWTYHNLIREKFEQMLEVKALRIGTFGDEIDNFHARSFAGAKAVYDQAISPPLQRILWDRWLDRIADRVLWATGSQHGTMWDERLVGFAPVKLGYLERGIPFFTGQGYVKLMVGQQQYNVAIAHAFPGYSMHNPNHPQHRAMQQRYPNADIVAMADKHQYSVQEKMVYNNEVMAGNRASPYVYLIQIGTMKAGPEPYTVKGWERGQAEWPFVVLWPDQHLIKVTRHFDDVLYWLGEKP